MIKGKGRGEGGGETLTGGGEEARCNPRGDKDEPIVQLGSDLQEGEASDGVAYNGSESEN